MKIVLIYRRPRAHAHSIEELFGSVAEQLQMSAEVIEFRVGSRWSIFADAWRLRKLRADIYHVTGDIHYMLLLLPWRKTVLTVHDTYHYSHQLKGLKRWLFKWLWFKLPVRAAGAVTVISEQTRLCLQRDMGLHRADIQVIADCVSPIFARCEKQGFSDPPRVLCIGTKPNKNLQRTIDALRGLPCELTIIGAMNPSLLRLLRDSGIRHTHRAGLTHEQIYRQYVEADIVCFPSLYEGFGMPIIEAQSTGRPVVTSNIEPMSSVAGGGACLVDPLSVDDIRRGVLKLLDSPEYRLDLIRLGYANAALYTTEAIASRYLGCYRQLHAHSPAAITPC